MKAWIHPQEEWRQISLEAWRIERDYFYDPNMHGVDWEAMKQRYAVLLPYIVDRGDLNYVIGEMIAELNRSHTYVGGGDAFPYYFRQAGLGPRSPRRTHLSSALESIHSPCLLSSAPALIR